MLKITDEMVEVAAQVIQSWHAPNTKLADVNKDFADAHRRLARHILESLRDNFMFSIKPGSAQVSGDPC